MKKWEYKTLEIKLEVSIWSGNSDFPNEIIIEQLNIMGEDGWELANTVANAESHGQTSKILLIFKRPKADNGQV